MKKTIISLFAAICLAGCTDPSGQEMMQELSFEGVTDSALTETENALETAETSASGQTAAATGSENEMIYVYVCGAVVSPAVYRLPAGSRAYEAVEAAGGVTEDAAPYMVNLAGTLFDEQKLYIPYEGEDYTPEESVYMSVPVKEEKVNINTASKEILMTLNGIGQSKADAIISYREQNGGFKTIEQIMEVSGIKQAAFDRIKNSITI